MENKDFAKIVELLEKDKAMYAILKQCPYEILREMQLKKYTSRQFVKKQGNVYSTFYIIVEGRVDIYVESERGKKYVLNSYGKGHFVGEMEIYRQFPYISSVEGKGRLTTLEVSREVFLKWMKLDHNFNEYVFRTLCDTTYAMCSNMGNNTLYTLKQRICQYFLEQADSAKERSIPIHTESLGEKMAVTQRSINRVLKQLQEKGIIEVGKTSASIIDYEALLEEREQK